MGFLNSYDVEGFRFDQTGFMTLIDQLGKSHTFYVHHELAARLAGALALDAAKGATQDMIDSHRDSYHDGGY